MFELKDGDAEIGLLPILLPTTTDPGHAFLMQPFKKKMKNIIKRHKLMLL
jgi:hypothetical protein